VDTAADRQIRPQLSDISALAIRCLHCRPSNPLALLSCGLDSTVCGWSSSVIRPSSRFRACARSSGDALLCAGPRWRAPAIRDELPVSGRRKGQLARMIEMLLARTTPH
jgi:hypothetical protein